MYVCVGVCAYIYVCMYVCMHMCIHVCMSVQLVCGCVHASRIAYQQQSLYA